MIRDGQTHTSATLSVLSRLKGIETISDVANLDIARHFVCAFPFEGN